MAVYCMSDIHGQRQAFYSLLEQVKFSDSDTLYVIGDVVDRGPEGIRLLQDIMGMKNVTMLLGNHEYMMLDYYAPWAGEKEISRWNRNGNRPTVEAFGKLDILEQTRILGFLKRLPDCLDMQVNGRDFFLVHGFPGENTHDAVWNRPRGVDVPNPVPGRQLIVGHTPVPSVLCRTDAQEEAYFRDLERRGDHIHILHAEGFLDIDCGCGHSAPGCALACLRLDDMAEFYQVVHTDHI